MPPPLPPTPPPTTHPPTPRCPALRADLARLRRELKAALMDWEREQALYAEVGGRACPLPSLPALLPLRPLMHLHQPSQPARRLPHTLPACLLLVGATRLWTCRLVGNPCILQAACPGSHPRLHLSNVQAVQEHLRLQAVVASLERGLPEEAPLAAQAAWLWRCHLHFWAFRCERGLKSITLLPSPVPSVCSIASSTGEKPSGSLPLLLWCSASRPGFQPPRLQQAAQQLAVLPAGAHALH